MIDNILKSLWNMALTFSICEMRCLEIACFVRTNNPRLKDIVTLSMLNPPWKYSSAWFTNNNNNYNNNKETWGPGLQEHNLWFPEVVSS